jgi:streptogramin lyase
MSETRARSAGNGITKTSARPIKIVVDPQGEYWICDKDAEISGFDFAAAGCVAHSDVHLVK